MLGTCLLMLGNASRICCRLSKLDTGFEEKTHFLGTQNHTGALNFATDAWTSPNHKAYVAVTVHFENAGVPISMLLDIVEVACSHSGFNFAAAFAKILEDFGISDKASDFTKEKNIFNSPNMYRFSR